MRLLCNKSDGNTVVSCATRDMMTASGVYQDNVTRVSAHLFEKQISVIS